VFTLMEEVETNEFEKWKTGMDLQSDHHLKEKVIKGIALNASKKTMNEILEKILLFDLSNATGVECLIFLSGIKKGIRVNEAIGTMEVLS